MPTVTNRFSRRSRSSQRAVRGLWLAIAIAPPVLLANHVMRQGASVAAWSMTLSPRATGAWVELRTSSECPGVALAYPATMRERLRDAKGWKCDATGKWRHTLAPGAGIYRWRIELEQGADPAARSFTSASWSAMAIASLVPDGLALEACDGIEVDSSGSPGRTTLASTGPAWAARVGAGVLAHGDFTSLRLGAAGISVLLPRGADAPTHEQRSWLGSTAAAARTVLPGFGTTAPIDVIWSGDGAATAPILFDEPWSGPVVLGRQARTWDEALAVGRQLLWRETQRRWRAADVDWPEQAWLLHASIELLAEAIARELNRSGEPPLEGVDPARARRAMYVGLAPHAYPVASGPGAGAPGIQRVGWQRATCPVTLGHVLAQVAGRDASVPPTLDELRGIYASVTGGDTPACVRELIDWRTQYGDVQGDFCSALPATRPLPREPRSGAALRMTLAVSADTKGFLETCGCAVSQLGGAARRRAALERIRLTSLEDVITIDLGDRYERHDGTLEPHAAAKIELIDELFDSARYDFLVEDVFDVLHRHTHGKQPRGSSATLRAADGSPIAPTHTIVNRSGKRIALIAASSLQWRRKDNAHWLARSFHADFRVHDPVAEVTRLVDSLLHSEAPPDVVLVCGALDPATIDALVAANPEVDAVLSSNDALLSESIQGGERRILARAASAAIGETAVFYFSAEAYAVGKVRLAFDAPGRLIHADVETVELGDEVQDDPATRARIDRHYASIANERAWELEALFPGNAGDGYAGSDACASCHAGTYQKWRASDHGQAYNTLLKVQRQMVPKCVQCHVVGLGEGPESGGVTWDRTDAPLLGVGCEMCHGGGRAHAVQPSRDNIRRSMDKADCMRCHDREHSPLFDAQFDQYLEKIRHW
ncbi:MAG: hypothetical protein GY711_33915 [bacterium]|nr:hypothetical protein [bacterium]